MDISMYRNESKYKVRTGDRVRMDRNVEWKAMYTVNTVVVNREIRKQGNREPAVCGRVRCSSERAAPPGQLCCELMRDTCEKSTFPASCRRQTHFAANRSLAFHERPLEWSPILHTFDFIPFVLFYSPGENTRKCILNSDILYYTYSILLHF